MPKWMIDKFKREGQTPAAIERLNSSWHYWSGGVDLPEQQQQAVAFAYGFLAGQQFESECAVVVEKMMHGTNS